MPRKYYYICVFFAIWTIVQSILHLIFVIYSYFLTICVRSPTDVPTIFYYITYLYNSECKVPKLHSNPHDIAAPETLLSFVFRQLYFNDNIEKSFRAIVEDLLHKLEFLPDRAPAADRASIFLLCFIILDGAWTISAMALLMGTCFQIRQSSALFFNTPWLILTACVSIFDSISSVVFAFDIPETVNFANWIKFVGITALEPFQDLDRENPSIFIPLAPTLTLNVISIRFFFIWLINWIGFFLVIRATKKVYSEKYRRNQKTGAQTGANVTAAEARIRNWQLFYGATETRGSQCSTDSKIDQDLNSNKKEVDEMPSVSGSVENYYYAYEDVAEVDENLGLSELRAHLPWSYINSSSEALNQRRLRAKSAGPADENV